MKSIRTLVAGLMATFIVASQVPQLQLSFWQVPQSEAAHAQNLVCDTPTSTNQVINCAVEVGRPPEDTGAEGDLELGVHFPERFPGINWINAPGFNCSQNQPGPKRLDCFGPVPLGGFKRIDFGLHVDGDCGTTQEINATVANPYLENSPLITHQITFPACVENQSSSSQQSQNTQAVTAQVLNESTPGPTPAQGNQCPANQQAVSVSMGAAQWKSNSDYNGLSHVNQLICPDGYVVTNVLYKDSNTGSSDAVDGLTIQCQRLLPNGTLGDKLPVMDNSYDFNGNDRQLSAFPCAEGEVYIGLRQKDKELGTENNDYLDGITTSCARISLDGLSQEHIGGGTDIAENNRALANASCQGGVLVGIQYDEEGNAAPSHDATDSVEVYCRPLIFACQANQPSTTTLTINKSGPSSVLRGSVISYTVQVSNTGQIAAQNVQVTDQVPNGLTYLPGSSDGSCSLNGSTVNCNLGTLNAGQSRNLTLAFQTQSLTGQCPGSSVTVQNTATVTSNQSSQAQSQLVTTSVNCPAEEQRPDVMIEKSGPSTVIRGTPFTYTLTARNNGTASANNVLITDVFPAGLTFNAGASSNQCSLQGNSVTCQVGTLNAGQNQTFQLSFTAPTIDNCSASTIFNSASISTSTQESNTGNNQSQTISTQLQCPTPSNTTLTIVKSGPSSVTRGATISYTVQVTNIGQVAAQNVVVTDQVPSGLTYISGSSDQSCSLNGSTVTCSIGTLNAGQSRSLTLVFQTPTIDQCSGSTSVQNTASVTSNQSSPVQSSITTTLNCPVNDQKPDLTVEKSGPASVNQGSPINYTLTVRNTGTAAAQSVTLTDIVPQGLTFNPGSSDQSCSLNGSTVTCALGTLSAGQVRILTLSFNTSSSQQCTPGSVQNSAFVTTSTQESNTGNNQSPTVTTQIQCPTPNNNADLSILKSGPASVTRGSTVAYTINVINFGPATAQNVTIVDAIPSGLTFVPAQSPGCLQNGNNVTCSGFDLVSGVSKTFTLVFQVPTIDNCTSSVIFNTATVTSNQSDPTTSNNQSSVTTTAVCPTASFTITKTDNRTTVSPNEVLTYTVSVTNTSQNAANNVTVTDTLPSLVTYISSSDNGSLNGQVVTWNNLSIPAGATKTLTVQARVSSSASNGSVIVNSAQVVGGPSSTDTTTVETANQFGCIQITKETVNQNGYSVTPVPAFTFRLDGNQTVQNNSNGQATFTNVPAGTHTVTEQSMDGWSQIYVSPSNGIVNVTAGSSCAVVSFKNQQVQSGNPTFTITKTDNRTTVTQGETLTYTITVTNTSNVNANNVTVTDSLPENVDYLSASDSGYLSGRTVTWNNLFIAAGSSRTLTLQVRVQQSCSNGFVITNTARVDGVTATDTTTVQTNGGNNTVSLDLSDYPDPVRPNEILTYKLRVTNVSSSQNNVNVTQVLPSEVDFLSASDGGSRSGTNNITWNLFLGSNETRTLTVTVRTDNNLEDGDTLYSTAYAGNATDDEVTRVRDDNHCYSYDCCDSHSNCNDNCGNYDDCCDSYDSHSSYNSYGSHGSHYSNCDSRIRLDITDTPDPVEAGAILTYTIAVRNDDSSSRTVDVRGFLDDQTEFVSGSNGADDYRDGEVRWDRIFLNRNSTTFLTLKVRVDNHASKNDTLQLRVTADGEDDREDTRVKDNRIGYDDGDKFAKVYLAKQSDRSEAYPGNPIYYSVTIRNTSNQTAKNVTVEDTLPSGMVTITDAGTGQMNGNMIRWTVASLEAGQSRTFSYKAKLSSSLKNGDSVTNNVRVTSGNLEDFPGASNTIRIIKNLPQTGHDKDYSGPMKKGGYSLSAMLTGQQQRAATVPVAVWTSIAMIGLAVGGKVGKRMFI